MSVKQATQYLKETYTRWSDHNAPRLGASVAFYSILSFAPLLVLLTAIIALVFGNSSAHGSLVNQAQQFMGERGGEMVDSLLKNSQNPSSGIFASVIAFITLLFGASGVFTELQDALNVMWDATNKQASGVIGMIKQRLFSFGMILSVGFLLLISLVISSGLAYVGHSFSSVLPLSPAIWRAINFIFSLVVVAVLFGLMFRYVPAVHVDWRDVIIGAIGTSILFTIGKFLLGIYLGKASVGSTYGAAGSLVAVVVWIYYSAQIFFFGAEFTRVYADAHNSQALPKKAEENAPAQSSAHAPERPKAMAAAASASPAYRPAPVQQTMPVTHQTALKPVVSLSSPVSHAVTTTNLVTTRRKPSKPRLLTAAALGFLLGRIVLAAEKKKAH